MPILLDANIDLSVQVVRTGLLHKTDRIFERVVKDGTVYWVQLRLDTATPIKIMSKWHPTTAFLEGGYKSQQKIIDRLLHD